MSARTWGFESPLAHRTGGFLIEGGRKKERSTPAHPKSGDKHPRKPAAKKRRGKAALPPWLTLTGSLLSLALMFAFIFFVVQGCIATQQATEVRKYVTGSDSTLSDSQGLGNDELQGILQSAGGNSASLNAEELSGAAEKARLLYRQALSDEVVPQEFEEAHPYLVSALGIRARATERLANAAGSDAGNFKGTLAAAVESYRVSDEIIREHYLPASKEALESAGQSGVRDQLYDPFPFMRYGELGFPVPEASAQAQSSDPEVLHGVRITGVRVGGTPLQPGGNVTLTGSEKPVFVVNVLNGGEGAETNVPVEVVLNTSAERQSRTQTIERIGAGKSASTEVGGFSPGVLGETARVGIEAGPVKYEERTDDNALEGTVTFGM